MIRHGRVIPRKGLRGLGPRPFVGFLRRGCGDVEIDCHFIILPLRCLSEVLLLGLVLDMLFKLLHAPLELVVPLACCFLESLLQDSVSKNGLEQGINHLAY